MMRRSGFARQTDLGALTPQLRHYYPAAIRRLQCAHSGRPVELRCSLKAVITPADQPGCKR
jgi:hypothetical protein